MASVGVYCVCGEGYDTSRFMIQCDACKEWFHGTCVDVKEHESLDVEKYHCAQCQQIFGPSLYKERKNWHRHDYADPNADGKAVQTGTPVFIGELRSRHFSSADEAILYLRGPQLTLPFLIQNGFDRPILVDSKIGLGLVMLPETFSVVDVMDYVGPDFPLDVIDVTKQNNIKMSMKEWVEYFNSPVRNKVYNVISLEFSNTRLSELVKPPSIVQKLSWVENYWPDTLPESFPFTCPQVMKYCLMGAQDSFTDFHIDFGGTSVWYHVLKGEKVFYLIRPTPANLSLYEHWMASSNQSETFFGDQVDACYQLVLSQGQTLFIPTGWIHAVLTSLDSLVFGGNFLHSLNIPLQLQVHEMEKRIKTPQKYQFPCFEVTHWFAAPNILEQLKDFSTNDRRALQHLVGGVKALIQALKLWSTEKDSKKMPQDLFALGITPSKLIKDLSREVRQAEKHISGKTKVEVRNIKSSPIRQKQVKAALVDIKVQEAVKSLLKASGHQQLGSLRDEKNSSLKFSLKPRLPSNNNSNNNNNNDLSNHHDLNDKDSTSTSPLSHIKLCISKSGLSLPESSDNALKMKLPMMSTLPIRSDALMDKNNSLRLKVSHGKIINEEKASLLKNDSVYDFVDSDEDNLVVDESPPPRRPRISPLRKHPPLDKTQIDSKQSFLKLRLSFNGKQPEEKPSTTKDTNSDASQDDQNSDAPKNGIDDLLIASGLAGDTESSRISLDDELSGGRTSPSTREAIQGMLSISKSAFLFNNPVVPNPPTSTGAGATSQDKDNSLSLSDNHVSANFSILAKKSSPVSNQSQNNTSKILRSRKYIDEDDDDFEETLKQCHQDGDFIYLGLEASDDEFHVFKPRGRTKRDEPWNPKAKLVPNCPKPERPVREGVRREAIECGLAAAAARLANMPPPKRQYHRKKALQSKARDMSSEPHPGPSTSSGLNIKRPLPPDTLTNKASKKPKKGFATAKQRLGKILKIHKMLY